MRIFKNQSKFSLFMEHGIKYGIVGVAGVVVDFGVFYIETKYLAIPYLIANIVSAHCGILNNFILNRIFTFKVRDEVVKRFLGYYSVALAGIAGSSLLLYIFIGRLHLAQMLSKVVALCVVTSIQFLINRSVTFRVKEEQK